MKYYGINYTKRRVYHTWRDWAWWILWTPIPTYHSDIIQRWFIRILGFEFKIMDWAPRKPKTLSIREWAARTTVSFATPPSEAKEY